MDVKLIWRCTNVTLCIPISTSNSIQISYEHIMPNIKFTIIVKHWLIYVHLNYVCSSIVLILNCFCTGSRIFIAWIVIWFLLCFLFTYSFYDIVQLVYFIYYCYPSALIWVLSRLHYPNISSFMFLFNSLFLLFTFLFFNLILSSVIICNESFVLGIF